MPLNQLKTYNALLELDHLDIRGRKISLMMIFKRDIEENEDLNFRTRRIYPTDNSESKMELLFEHLTTEKDKQTPKREYDPERSKRLHWVRYHLEEQGNERISIFSVKEREGIRTYIYDTTEKYVIILEPYRNGCAYYLITAYYLRGGNNRKIINKQRRKLPMLY